MTQNTTFVSHWWPKLVQYTKIADQRNMDLLFHVTPVILLLLLFFDRWGGVLISKETVLLGRCLCGRFLRNHSPLS